MGGLEAVPVRGDKGRHGARIERGSAQSPATRHAHNMHNGGSL